MNNAASSKLQTTHSRISILPHWDGAIYTRYAARFYDLTTTITGWRNNLAQHALEGLAPGKLLDVGCGTGYLMHLAENRGFTTFGIDPSEGMLEKAKIHHGFEDSQLHAVSANALPFEAASFDTVVASGSLVHIPELTTVAQEIQRVLKPKGILRVIDHAEPQEKSLNTPWFYAFSHLSGDILHDYAHYFAEGFTLENRKTIGRGGYLQQFDFRKTASI